MKFLFDNNLSPSLARSLAADFPHCAHCADLGLTNADDLTVWTYARVNGFTLITKDNDFNALVTLRGFPHE